MEFCPKCGIILVKKGDKFVCSKCHYVKNNVVMVAKEKMNEKKASEGIHISQGEENNLPVVKAVCPKCKNESAYFWCVQTRGGDESETSFFKCTKCKHTWRSYR